MQDPLRAFLTGKRSAKRHALEVPVQISGPALWIVGESIDVSSNGVCMRVALSDMFDDADTLNEDSSFELVKIALDEGIKLLFPLTSIVAEASPVRVALDPDREGWLRLGCRLNQNLGMLELSRLGLNPAECGPENPMYGPPSQALPLQLNGGPEIRVSLFGVDDQTTRLFEGKLVALGQQSLAVTLHREEDPHEVLRQIGCLELYFRAMRGSEVVWASRAMIAALPMLSAATGRVEIGLVASSLPSGNLTEVFTGKEDTKASTAKPKAKRAKKKKAARKKSAKRKASKKKGARKRKAAKKRTARKKSAKKKAAARAPDVEPIDLVPATPPALPTPAPTPTPTPTPRPAPVRPRKPEPKPASEPTPTVDWKG